MTEFSSTGKPISAEGGFDEARASGGEQSFWLEGKLHRTDGPALITREGDQHWYLHGRRHNAEGPAIVKADGRCLFFVDGNPQVREMAHAV